MKPLRFLLGGPLGAAAAGAEAAYPFTQDKNFPGVAEARHARGQAMRDTIRNNPQANPDAMGALPGIGSSGDVLKWLKDPYGINARHAEDPMTAGGSHVPTAVPQAPVPSSTGVPALGGLGLFPPAAPMSQTPMQTAMATPAHLPQPAPQPSQAPPVMAQGPTAPQGMALQYGPISVGGAPIAEGPQKPENTMGFFARNAAMMQDPSSGAFLDPVNAARAQASGPDVIQKLLDMFHRKDA